MQRNEYYCKLARQRRHLFFVTLLILSAANAVRYYLGGDLANDWKTMLIEVLIASLMFTMLALPINVFLTRRKMIQAMRARDEKDQQAVQ